MLVFGAWEAQRFSSSDGEEEDESARRLHGPGDDDWTAADQAAATAVENVKQGDTTQGGLNAKRRR